MPDRSVTTTIDFSPTFFPIALGLSAFTVDLNQMSRALNNFSGNTLILVDEFGKGTTEKDGQALLGACIDHWCQQGIENNPFVLGTYIIFKKTRQILIILENLSFMYV